MDSLTFYEFFAGGGMARAGLGRSWECLFANDFDAMKVETYRRNWGAGHIREADVATLTTADLPGRADLAWASFPCQDLSLAGSHRGLEGARSGTFWPFWRLMRDLRREGRAPRAIVLENVHGLLTSHEGRDFAALADALAGEAYRFGALVVNAARFVPQSRPRVFFVAVAEGEPLHGAISDGPCDAWHPQALRRAHSGLSRAASRRWLWWNPPEPPPRALALADIVEARASGVEWRTPQETGYLLSLMSEVNLAKVAAARRSGQRTVGAIYRRTRADGADGRRQRAEVRFDGVSGCLRTPAGGSSRQTILVVEGMSVRSRLLSAREAARLMGLSDDYWLPARYNDAYHVCGDGVCAPIVGFLGQTLLEPILRRSAPRIAAE